LEGRKEFAAAEGTGERVKRPKGEYHAGYQEDAMKMRLLVVAIVLIGVGAALWAGQPMVPPATAPAEAKTTEEIVKAVEPAKGFGQIQTAEFNRWGRRVFAIWFCPFSGRGDCFVRAYYFDYEKAQWTRFFDQLVAANGDLSAEMPTGTELVFHGTDGKVTVKESVEKFPAKKP
jgi:hypothetical protein